ncbi:MAG TPA: YggS family pyridoxal phosphate-dependent enzyme [Gemmatimonadaceae bacterium]
MQFPELVGRLQDVGQRISEAVARGGHQQQVQIIAVTKTHGPDAVSAAWHAGIRAVGENKVQEALDKIPLVPEPVAWHLIGHLQRNKVRHLDRFALFHALDSERLADAIADREQTSGRRTPVLVQVNCSGEASKGGFTLDSLPAVARRLREGGELEVRGAMTMAPLDAGERVLRSTFGGCRQAREVLRDAGFDASELSMGMSADYEVAVEEGATLVRLGTILFGARTQ